MTTSKKIRALDIPSLSQKRTYTSGRQIADDAVLERDVICGLLFEHTAPGEVDLKTIWYHPDEIGVVYDYDTSTTNPLSPNLPTLKLIV